MLFVDDCLTTYPRTKSGVSQYKAFIALLQREYKLQEDGMADAKARQHKNNNKTFAPCFHRTGVGRYCGCYVHKGALSCAL
jgi:hypothetical protein